MQLAPGTRLGLYEIVAPLGAGGMGEVYRARDPRLGREVAIKVLPAAISENADRLRRFEQEARAAGALNHPNLLTVFELGEEDGAPYIVSELLEGETLRERIRQRGAFPLKKAAEVALQIASGLAAAHEKGIVHRDLKPENIFLTHDGRVKLLDFGLAKVTAPAADSTTNAPTAAFATTPGVVMGTTGYMAPEQVRGETVDARADIFSFGVVLHEMLTGDAPFRRDSSVETMNAILKDDAPPLAGAVPQSIERIVHHMLEKNPSHRFQSARDVAFAVEALSGSGETSSITSAKEKKKKGEKPAAPQAFTRVTFRRGNIMSARFAPDGSILYGAMWEDRPVEIFSSHVESPESRPLGLPEADIFSISPTGELALGLGRYYTFGWETTATLARMPLMGGAPRELAEDVQGAEWGPDGKKLLVYRRHQGMFRIEYPLGEVIFESPDWISHARFSPKGDRIAFLEHPDWGDDGAHVHIIDLEGKTTMLSPIEWTSTSGLAWTPKGDEVLVAADSGRTGRDLVGVGLNGKVRAILPALGRMTLYDVSPKGAVLASFDNARREIMAGKIGQTNERNLSWFDWSFPVDLSRDGTRVVFEEQGGATRGGEIMLYLRKLDGSPAIHLGEGRRPVFTPDGKWVLAVTGAERKLELLPTGAGSPRVIPCEGIGNKQWLCVTPDGSRACILSRKDNQGFRLFTVPIDTGGEAKPVTPEGVSWPIALTPDGSLAAAISPDGRVSVYPTDGSEGRLLTSSVAGDRPIQFADDGKNLFVYQRGRLSVRIERIDITTGERSLWHEIRPADPAGIIDLMPVYMTPDGQTYAYGYRRLLSDLFVVENVL